jgi:lipoprotein-releasing system ATP-binding protein
VPRLTAAANVELPMIFAGVERADRRSRVAQALDSVGLSERAKHRPDQLSGGERQRVAIARSVVMNPSILLADEPTGNLDPETADAVFEQLLSLVRQNHLAALVATHNMALAARMDRTLSLRNGQISSES